MTIGPSFPGYSRPGDLADDLNEAIAALVVRNPEQRFGQLIANLMRPGEDLFNILDENMLDRINGRLENPC